MISPCVITPPQPHRIYTARGGSFRGDGFAQWVELRSVLFEGADSEIENLPPTGFPPGDEEEDVVLRLDSFSSI